MFVIIFVLPHFSCLNTESSLLHFGQGTPATTSQMAKDVTTFLSWAAEPELDERKKMGLQAVIILSALTGMLSFLETRHLSVAVLTWCYICRIEYLGQEVQVDTNQDQEDCLYVFLKPFLLSFAPSHLLTPFMCRLAFCRQPSYQALSSYRST